MKRLLLSSKFQAALTAMIAAIVLHVGWNVPVEAIAAIVSPICVYIAGTAYEDAAAKKSDLPLP